MLRRLCRLASGLFAAAALSAAEPAVRNAPAPVASVLTDPAKRPAEFRYNAFPTLLRTGPDEVLLAFKAGRNHATDSGAAMEIVRHTLSTGTTQLVQRLVAPAPKLYQMGELVRFPDGGIALYIDVQSVGWDGRHYRSGAEVARWDAARGAFGAPALLAPVDGVLYGYPLEFISEGRATWQLIMAFGYHQPGGRWSVDTLRTDDSGRSWRFVHNLTAEFGGIRANESGFTRHGDGFIVATRGYDRMVRLHRTDAEFRVKTQVDLTGKVSFINNVVGRPRVFVRDGQGYLIGRNWTKAASGSPMQLCLIRFDPQTLAVNGCVILDNADDRKVTDGYYAVTEFSGAGVDLRLHVFTYKALDGQPPGIVRMDFRWADVK